MMLNSAEIALGPGQFPRSTLALLGATPRPSARGLRRYPTQNLVQWWEQAGGGPRVPAGFRG